MYPCRCEEIAERRYAWRTMSSALTWVWNSQKNQ
jgi:hypothetical protein